MKAFVDHKIEVVKVMIFVFDRVENLVGKGENAGYQYFLLFSQSFNPFLHIYSFKHIEEKGLRKVLWIKVKFLISSNFTFFHNVFCILKSFNSHISLALFNFFEFGIVSKWCIWEWVKKVLFLRVVNSQDCVVKT